MSGTYRGQIAAAGGGHLEVDLELSSQSLRLATVASEIGSWPLGDVHIAPNGDGTFSISVDGDAVGFSPLDPMTFGQAVAVLGNGGTGVEEPATAPDVSARDEGEGAGATEEAVGRDAPSAALPARSADVISLFRDIGDGDAVMGQVVAAVEAIVEPEEVSPLGAPSSETGGATDHGEALVEQSADAEALVEGHVGDTAGEDDESMVGERPAVDEAEDAVASDAPAEVGGDGRVASLASRIRARKAESGVPGEDGAAPVAGLGELRSRLRVADRALLKKVGIGAALLLAVAVVGATGPTVLSIFSTSPQAASTSTTVTSPPSTEATTVTTTPPVGPPETAAPVEGGIFGRPADGFVAAWNEVGAPVASVLRFRQGLLPGEFRVDFTEHVGMTGVVGPDETMDSITVVLDPNGPGASDRLGLQAMGVAIAVVEPDSRGPDRAALLRSLGLDVSNPRLDGIDGSISRSGAAYRLVYDAEAELLSLAITPAG